jgi:hypothetical protein
LTRAGNQRGGKDEANQTTVHTSEFRLNEEFVEVTRYFITALIAIPERCVCVHWICRRQIAVYS